MMRKKRAAAAPAVEDDSFGEAAAASIPVGARCVTKAGAAGVVRFVGRIPELKPGFWVRVCPAPRAAPPHNTIEACAQASERVCVCLLACISSSPGVRGVG
jgi:hypothetical protein